MDTDSLPGSVSTTLAKQNCVGSLVDMCTNFMIARLYGCMTTQIIFMYAGLLTGWARTVSLFVVSIFLAYLNYRGLTIVGRVAIGMTLFIIVTFIVLVCASIPHIQPRNWLVVDLPSVDWRSFINVMFW